MGTQEVSLDSNELFIGGEWVKPRGSDRIEVFSATTEELIGSVPEGTNADIDAAVARRPRPSTTRRLVVVGAEDRAQALERLADALEARGEETARRVSMQNGMPICDRDADRGERSGAPRALLRRPHPSADGGGAHRAARGHDPDHAQAGRRRRRDRAVELPAGAGDVQARAGARRGLHRGHQAEPGDGARRVAARRGAPEAGIPAGVVNIVPARPRGRRLPGRASGHRQGRVHRLDRGGPLDRRASAASCCARSRSSSAASRRRSCSTTPTSPSPPRRCSARRCSTTARPVTSAPGCSPRARATTRSRRLRRFAGALQVGDSLDPETQIGPLASRAPARPRRGLHRQGQGRGRAARRRRRAGRSGRGWFVQPTVFADVDNDHTIAREEIFGPVLAVIPYDDVEDALGSPTTPTSGSAAPSGRPTRSAARRRRARADRHDRDQPLRARPGGAVRRRQGKRPRPRARARGPGAVPAVAIDLPAGASRRLTPGRTVNRRSSAACRRRELDGGKDPARVRPRSLGAGFPGSCPG